MHNVRIYYVLFGLIGTDITGLASKISAAVAILAVPTTIGAVHGMNFDNMPELHTRYGYFVVLAVMISGMVSVAVYFRRKHWL